MDTYLIITVNVYSEKCFTKMFLKHTFSFLIPHFSPFTMHF